MIREEAEKKDRASLRETADRLHEELESIRKAAYEAMADPSDADRALEARARVIEMAGRCAHGAIISAAGRGNLADHAAQRVYREALAFTVLAQNRMIQEATLKRLIRGPL